MLTRTYCVPAWAADDPDKFARIDADMSDSVRKALKEGHACEDVVAQCGKGGVPHVWVCLDMVKPVGKYDHLFKYEDVVALDVQGERVLFQICARCGSHGIPAVDERTEARMVAVLDMKRVLNNARIQTEFLTPHPRFITRV